MNRLSVRKRLTLWFAGSAMGLVALMGAGVFAVERAVLDQRAKRSLSDDLASVRADLMRDPRDIAGVDRAGLAEAMAVWRDGETEFASQDWIQFGLSSQIPAPGVSDLHGRRVRVMIADLPGGRTVGVAHDETDTSTAIDTLGFVLLAGTPVAIVGVLIMGWNVSGRALAPVGSLGVQLERIRADRPEERVAVGDNGDEFDVLSRSINGMLDRLQSAMEVQRRFVADASHQLRTPLTAQRVVGESALRQHADDPAVLRDVIASMLEESDQLSGLTSGLLDLARTERTRRPFIETDLLALARSVVDRLEPLADSVGLTLVLEGGAVWASTDADAVRRTLHGLVENSLAYCPAPGTVRMRVASEEGRPVVVVEDDGPGIEAIDRDRIFEPFYRGRGVGGTPGSGLGLAIARAATASAGGNLELVGDRGAVFRITLEPTGVRK